MSKFTFGRYVPSDSFADKCDPRGKLLLLIAYITAVFLAKNFYGLAVVAAMLIVFMAAAKASPLKVLAAVKGVLFLLLFTVIINLFFYKGGEPIFSWGLSESRKRAVRHVVSGGAAGASRLRIYAAYRNHFARRAYGRAGKSAYAAEMDSFPRTRTGAHHVHRASVYSHSIGRNRADYVGAAGARRRFRNGRACETRESADSRADTAFNQRVPAGGRTGRRDGRALLFGQQSTHEV